MLVLSVDSSSNASTCAIVDENRVFGGICLTDKKQHSIILMDLIDRLLKDCELTVADFSSGNQISDSFSRSIVLVENFSCAACHPSSVGPPFVLYTTDWEFPRTITSCYISSESELATRPINALKSRGAVHLGVV